MGPGNLNLGGLEREATRGVVMSARLDAQLLERIAEARKALAARRPARARGDGAAQRALAPVRALHASTKPCSSTSKPTGTMCPRWSV